MAVSGMTGFGRAEASVLGRRWVWEVRSVNGRGLDIKSRLPSGLEGLEGGLRDEVKARFRRGSIQAALAFARDDADTLALHIDAALVETLVAAGAPWIADGRVAPPRWDGLLQVRGVVTAEGAGVAEVNLESAAETLRPALITALDQLAEARAQEGRALEAALQALIGEIERLTAAALQEAEAAPGALAARLRARLAQLAPEVAIDPQRLAQEAALLASKADIREELVRLTAHAQEARALLVSVEPAGRRLEFLAQEFNREANTLCAKSSDLALTRIGLDLKTAIDQLREQAANVE